MHTDSLARWQCDHDYLPPSQRSAERRTRLVVALTLATMVVELAAGYLTGSLALVADGWHMGSHAAALGITAFAYAFARRHADDARFTFGTGKVGSLAGYSSALLLAVIALWMGAQAVDRLLAPVAIEFDAALAVAVVGLAVNVACALILGQREPGHDGPRHGEPRRHHDHNLRSAYRHVLADALTSLLAIAALAGGKYLGWTWLDPLMGLVGAALISWWAWGLLRDSGRVLLDAEDNSGLVRQLTRLAESGGDRVADLHVWRVGPASHACIVSIVTHDPRPAEHYKAKFALPGIAHLTVEVNACG